MSIDKIPSNIEYLTFGNKFNQPLGDMLPSKLKYLKFGEDFNQHVDNLPSGLLCLKFDQFFK